MVGKKILYGALGLIATGLGIVGVWLPGLPTTVFILIALWAFSNSSPRLHRWLTRIPLLKHALREAHRFQREGTIAPRVKLISQGSAWLSFASASLITQSIPLMIILGLLAVSCSVFMAVMPSSLRSEEPAQSPEQR